MSKIGMCMMCGGSFPKSQTVLVGSDEYCRPCAEMMGFEDDDEEDIKDDHDHEDKNNEDVSEGRDA